MAELIAQGPKPEQRWQQPLPAEEPIVLGRHSPPWSVPWDGFISRQHALLTWQNGSLTVEKLPTGRNPICRNGKYVDQCRIGPGDSFVIGQTTFRLEDEPLASQPAASQMVRERTFNEQELSRVLVNNAAHQLEVLRQLPGTIAQAANEGQLLERLGNLLLAGLTTAGVVGLVALESSEPPKLGPGREKPKPGTRFYGHTGFAPCAWVALVPPRFVSGQLSTE